MKRIPSHPPSRIQWCAALFLVTLFILVVEWNVQSRGNNEDSIVVSAKPIPSSKSEEIVPNDRLWSKKKKFVIWSNDFHISPIADLKHIWKDFNIAVIDQSLSGHCGLKGTCQTSLKVINTGNGMDLIPDMYQIRRSFFETYKEEFKNVDAFVCNHPAAMCEIFMPFNKSIIVQASTRFELGRFGANCWKEWIHNLRAIAADPRNVVGANNLYDLEYVRYFTGLDNLVLLPSLCAYAGDEGSYQVTVPDEILIGPSHFSQPPGFLDELRNKIKGKPKEFKFVGIRERYPSYTYRNLMSHPAILLLPYQVSTMSMFEYYRMAIPMLAPSKALLAKWQKDYTIMTERTWDRVLHGFNPKESTIPRHPNADHPYDPNNEQDFDAIEYWVKFSDFYQWKHIIYFDSADDLVEKLQRTDFQAVSKKMKVWDASFRQDVAGTWEEMFHRMFDFIEPGERIVPNDFDTAMRKLYHLEVPKTGRCTASYGG